MFEQNPNNQAMPSNQPLGQPQNPFIPASPAPQNYPSAPAPIAETAPVEDMFSATDQSGTTGGNASQNMFQNYQRGPQISDTDLFGGGGLPWGRIITIAIIVLVVIGAIAAGFWGYSYFSSIAKAPAINAPIVPQTPVDTTNTANTGAETAAPIAESSTPSTVITDANKDSDGDGLADMEEKTFGTDLNLADTDADGLTDWAEVKIYKTDPLNPDTDADGYKDGAEVINGYDPLKPGSARLYDAPKATSTQ